MVENSFVKSRKLRTRDVSAIVMTSERKKGRKNMGCGVVSILRLTCFPLNLVKLQGVLRTKWHLPKIFVLKS